MKLDDLKGKTLSGIAKAILKNENILSIALTENEGGMLGEMFQEHGPEETSVVIAALLIHRHNNNFMKSFYDGFNLFTESLKRKDIDFTPEQRSCLEHVHFEIRNWLAWDTNFTWHYRNEIRLVDNKGLTHYKGWPIKGVSKLSARQLLNLGNALLWITLKEAEFKEMVNSQRIVYTMAGVNFQRIQKIIFGLKEKGSKP